MPQLISLLSFNIAVNKARYLLIGDLRSRIWLLVPFLFVIILGSSVDEEPFFLYTFTVISWWAGSFVVTPLGNEKTKWITDIRFLSGLFVLELVTFSLGIVHFWGITSPWPVLNLLILCIVLFIDALSTCCLLSVLVSNAMHRESTNAFFHGMSDYQIARITSHPRKAWYNIETKIMMFTMPLKRVDSDNNDATNDAHDDFVRDVGEVQGLKTRPFNSNDLL